MQLSKPQQLICDMVGFAGAEIATNCSSILFDGKKSVGVLQHAVNALFQLNDALRIQVREQDGVMTQTIRAYREQAFEVLQFEDDTALHCFANEWVKQPIQYGDNLCEIKIVILPGQYGILTKLHHLISDAWTFGLLFTQFNEILNGQQPAAYSYFDYCESETAYRNSKRFLKDREYFRSQIEKCESLYYISNKSEKTFRAARKVFVIDSEKAQLIRTFSQSRNFSVFTVFMFALSIYISMVNRNAERFFIGTTVLNRNTDKELHTAGMFVNTVPCPAELDFQKSVIENLEQIEESLFSVFRHQKFNYDDLSTVLSEAAYKSRVPSGRLYDVMLSYMNAAVGQTDADFHTTWYFNGVQNESLQINIDDRDRNGVYQLHYDYQTDKLRAEDVERLHNRLMHILFEVLNAPEKKLSNLSLLTKAEQQQLLCDFNNTQRDYPKNKCVYDLFEQQTAASPDIPRITDGDKAYTFADLRLAAEKTDAFIRSRVGSTKQVIGVLCDRSFLQLGAIYGIVRGGNAYLPILPDYPPERIRTILEASGCKLVLAQKQYQHLAEQACAMEEILRSALPVPESVPAAKADDLLYVIYTSGSTGTPKGAMVTNRSAVNRIRWMANRFFDTSSVIMLKTPYSFDVSVWEIFAFAMYGFSLYILPPGEHYRQTSVLAHIAKGTVTDLHFVPTVFEQFLTALRQDEDPRSKLRSLRHIILSGESVSAHEINIFRQYHDGQVSVHNLYGPAECTVDVTAYTCAGTETDPIPIGKPIDNTQIYIVDKYLQPVPVGVTGELCIAGDGVGEGYLNRPELTAEKFIGNPFGEGRLYKTGDLAYWREDGNIVFVGRNDLQFKLNGQRIELGEIEAALSAVEGIESAAMTVRKAETGRQLLCAYYTGTEISGTDLRIQIGKVLPRYMVPQVFVRLESMPINASGKLDRTALSELSLPAALPTQAIEEPLNETERAVIGIFRRILKTDQVGRTTDFTEIGGTSLDVVQALSQEPLTKISASAFLNNPTPADLAKLITAENTVTYGQTAGLQDMTFQTVSPLYVPGNADAAYVLFSYAGGNAASYTALVHTFRKQNSSVALFFCDWLTSEQLETAADEIRAIANAVPVRFYSHCAGIVTAMKLIDILNKNSIIVEEYICGANIPPKFNSRMIHIWKYTPDVVLLHILRSAGLNTDGMTDQMISAFLRQFRQNTAETAAYFNRNTTKLPCPVKAVIATGDLFTKNYRLAKRRWEQYTDEFMGVLFLKTDDHYFNNSLAPRLAEILKRE